MFLKRAEKLVIYTGLLRPFVLIGGTLSSPYLEQATGIEPARSAWEAEILPLNYACTVKFY